MKISNKLVLGTVMISALSLANADFVGAVSNNNNGFQLEAGESNVDGGPHQSGNAGIGLEHAFQGSFVDFSGLSSVVQYELNKGVKVYNLNDPYGPSDHSGMGDFRFAQVGNADVWFGEWSQAGSDGNFEFANRQVYYSGDHSGTSMPANGGTASYVVYGINHAETAGLFKGEVDADFDNNTLNGWMVDGAGWVTVNATINAGDASFAGSALSMGVNGKSKGHFFGAGAASLAGIATFASEPGLDTAFGGVKKP